MKTEWNKADENGIINVPDELDPLINKVGMQFNFVEFSGKNKNQAICDIVKGCQDFFEKKTEWVSVDERLPENNSWYLVIERNQVNFLFLDSTNPIAWLNVEGDFPHKVTHWMPLPQPPQ